MAFLCLGIVVMGLSAFERAVQVNRWSSLVGTAAETGVLKNEKFAERLNALALPGTPFINVLFGTGLVISVLAIWRLVIETRSKKDPPI